MLHCCGFVGLWIARGNPLSLKAEPLAVLLSEVSPVKTKLCKTAWLAGSAPTLLS